MCGGYADRWLWNYAELHCHSHYSFLNGTSCPAVLVERAACLGLKGLALTDDNALYGVIPFVKKCKDIGLEYIIGSLITVGHARGNSYSNDKVLLLCENSIGYQNLSQLITRARGEDVKSEPRVTMEQIAELSDGLICLIGKNSSVAELLQTNRIDSARKRLYEYHHIFGNRRLYIQLVNHLEPGDTGLCKALYRLAQETSLGLCSLEQRSLRNPRGGAVAPCAPLHCPQNPARKFRFNSRNQPRTLSQVSPKDAAAILRNPRRADQYSCNP